MSSYSRVDVFYSKISKTNYSRMVYSSYFYTDTNRRNVKSVMIDEAVVKRPSMFTTSVY